MTLIGAVAEASFLSVLTDMEHSETSNHFITFQFLEHLWIYFRRQTSDWKSESKLLGNEAEIENVIISFFQIHHVPKWRTLHHNDGLMLIT